MAQPYNPPLKTRLLRWVLRNAIRQVFRLLSPVNIVGRENIPKEGAYLIAVNHVSLYDPPLVLSFWPVAAEAIGAVDIWQRPGQSQLVSLYGTIPVHRGEYDRQLLETMLAMLRSGRPLLIMPEGSRSHVPGMHRAEPGVAYLIEKTHVPVVPVGVVGTTDDYLSQALKFKRPPLQIVIGIPFQLPAIEGKADLRRQARQRNADLIMAQVAALLPREYQGVYADAAILQHNG
jgi:1-acyl-sn-glycerol-3-phosphate acyltransferase